MPKLVQGTKLSSHLYFKKKVNIRNRIPAPIKSQLVLLKRTAFDIANGVKFAKQRPSNPSLTFSIQKQQEIKQTGSSSSKKNNLIQATKRIETIQINPQETFSFWKAVGRPTTKRGFEEGRTIINGGLQSSVGGGLCQLAGLIYYISLEANLEIIERHNHSIDIYTEKTRYTPLGSDAAVAYGYKDLRIKNNLDFTIKFSFSIHESSIIVNINSAKKIEKSEVNFKSNRVSDKQTEAVTRVNGLIKVKSNYLNLGH